MSFATWAALAVSALVLAPLLAHLLRRRPPPPQPFAATALVPAKTAVTERRVAVEDRALLSVRALSVLALAVLGATPLVRCSRLSMAREGGASVAVAIVVDDSLSMRAASQDDPAVTRFAAAVEGARQVVATLKPGDAVTIVLAGKPARVALSATGNFEAAREVLDRLVVSDRGGDVAAVVRLARGLLTSLQQVDKRVVLLSDLAVTPTQRQQPLAAATDNVKLWVPLASLRGPIDDCAVVLADRRAERVVVQLQCSAGAARPQAPARQLQLVAGDEVLVAAPLPRRAGRIDMTLRLSEQQRSEHATTQLYVRLSGGDAIAADDAAPVMAVGGELVVGVIADATAGQVATGGPPAIEQAFAALRLGIRVKPMVALPEQAQALGQLGLLVIDDAPGFTPAQRRRLARWVERGGVLLLALGERSAAAPLGSGFAPVLPALVRWDASAPAGLDLTNDDYFGPAAAGMDQLAARGRSTLTIDEPSWLQTRARWTDGAPLLVERRLGRGVVYALTLSLATADSEFMLRGGSLALLHRLVDTARAQGGASRTVVGRSWPLGAFDEVKVRRRGADGSAVEVPLAPGGEKRFIPAYVGVYELQLDGDVSRRVAAVDPDEISATSVDPPAASSGDALGSQQAAVDVSAYVAVLLLALFATEMALRSWRRLGAG